MFTDLPRQLGSEGQCRLQLCVRYRARMKQKESPKGSITKTLLRDLLNRQKAGNKGNAAVPSVEKPTVKQPAQPALYQDEGSGFNPDFTFPQD